MLKFMVVKPVGSDAVHKSKRKKMILRNFTLNASDQNQISICNINALSIREVTRIKYIYDHPTRIPLVDARCNVWQ